LAQRSRGATARSLAAIWIYGIKTDNEHAKETGQLELETLILFR
jgi:hypothetical protein